MAVFNIMLDFDRAERRRIEKERFTKTHELNTRSFKLEEKKFAETKRAAQIGEGFVGRRLKEAERFGKSQTSVAERSVGVQEEAHGLAGVIASEQQRQFDVSEKRLAKAAGASEAHLKVLTATQELSNQMMIKKMNSNIFELERQAAALAATGAQEVAEIQTIYNNTTLKESKRLMDLPDDHPEKKLFIKVARGFDENQALADEIRLMGAMSEKLRAELALRTSDLAKSQFEAQRVTNAIGFMLHPQGSKVFIDVYGADAFRNQLTNLLPSQTKSPEDRPTTEPIGGIGGLFDRATGGTGRRLPDDDPNEVFDVDMQQEIENLQQF